MYARQPKQLQNPNKASPNTRCQKCLKLGHHTFQCTGSRPYLSRPSHSKLLATGGGGKGGLGKRPDGPSVEVPEEFKSGSSRMGLADKILKAKEAERERIKAEEAKPKSAKGKKRRDSVSSSGSDSDESPRKRRARSSSSSDSDSDSDSRSASSRSGSSRSPSPPRRSRRDSPDGVRRRSESPRRRNDAPRRSPSPDSPRR